MSINNIEKQYNKDLDILKKKIESLKNTLNQYNKISSNSVSCNSDYRIPPVLENGIYNIVSVPYPGKKLSAVYCWTGKQKDCKPALWGNTEEAKWNIINLDNLDNNKASKIICPKNLPKCLKMGNDDYGICITKDSNLIDLENNILLLNNDIINIFTNLNQNLINYKNNPEMLKMYNEIKYLDNSLSIEINKELMLLEEQNNIKKLKDSVNIRKTENRYNNYLLLLVILVTYTVYSLYRGENYDNIDYIILFLILLYVAYIAYMTFYK